MLIGAIYTPEVPKSREESIPEKTLANEKSFANSCLLGTKGGGKRKKFFGKKLI
jgi:hypothetical protein